MQFWIILLDPSNRFRRMRRLLYILPTLLCVSAHRVGTHDMDSGGSMIYLFQI